MKRYAIIVGARDAKEAAAYLPDNYRIIHTFLGGSLPGRVSEEHVIMGEDKAGWTLDGYVIPRLHSGSIGCREIDLSHPVMKNVPYDCVIGLSEATS